MAKKKSSWEDVIKYLMKKHNRIASHRQHPRGGGIKKAARVISSDR